MEIKIFYSWQSDLPNRTNRSFIETALKKAVKNIRDDDSISIEPVIDRDTAGVPGSPNIAETILKKIDECHIFVGDVSIINKGSTKRKTPNPNVMIEFGYALKKLSFARIVMVLNNAFGTPEELPFDLKMKRALDYNASESQQYLSEERNNLVKKIERTLKTILKDIEVTQDDKSDQKINPIALSIERKDNNITPQRHDYQLIVKLKNNSNRIIRNYYIEIEFLKEFLAKQSSNSSHIVPSRNDFHYTFFRFKGGDMKEFYPGDPLVLGHIHYFVDHKLYMDCRHLFDKPIRVSVFLEGYQPIILEKFFKELQNF